MREFHHSLVSALFENLLRISYDWIEDKFDTDKLMKPSEVKHEQGSNQQEMV